jgi:hypothetical protein
VRKKRNKTTELNPSRQFTSRAVAQEFPKHFKVPKVHRRVHKSPLFSGQFSFPYIVYQNNPPEGEQLCDISVTGSFFLPSGVSTYYESPS